MIEITEQLITISHIVTIGAGVSFLVCDVLARRYRAIRYVGGICAIIVMLTFVIRARDDPESLASLGIVFWLLIAGVTFQTAFRTTKSPGHPPTP